MTYDDWRTTDTRQEAGCEACEERRATETVGKRELCRACAKDAREEEAAQDATEATATRLADDLGRMLVAVLQ